MAKFRLSLIFFLIIFTDQITKWLALHQGIAQLNTGVSFGLFANLGLLMQIVLVLCTLVLLVWICRDSLKMTSFPLVIVSAGSISNLIDRIRVGGVVDFLPIPFTGIHNNIADWVIAVSLCWVVVALLREDSAKKSSSTITQD